MVFFLALWPSRWRRTSSSRKKNQMQQPIPSFSKDIPEVKRMEGSSSRSQISDRSLSFDASSSSSRIAKYNFRAGPTKLSSDENLQGSSSSEFTAASGTNSSQDIINLGWGSWYSLSELQLATDDFSEHNIVGEGGYGVVYKGRVPDGTLVAVKCLTNKGQAHEFAVEVETIGRVRHKNLVRLFGYCAEGDHRLLIYEYMNNGNLDQWLHGPASKVQNPNWDARMKIILGTAKGLAYLHEALEPKIVHRDIKASNILLDTRWNAKVADFGLAKLLGSETTHVMTRVMGTFGYVAPEYASTGLLNERSDVYSFGVLLVEVVTGREPVDYSRPAGEVNLVDWLKMMLSTRRLDEIADPRLEEKPSPRALKKALITALQCVHPDAGKRPTMGHIVHILEAESFHLPDKWKSAKGSGLSKLVESQKQHQTAHNFTKELPDFDRPRRQRYEA